MSSLRRTTLSMALLRAAAEGRLHYVGQVYRWRPRAVMPRALSTPGITETGAQLHAFGLISHHESDTTCALTDRGRAELAAHQEKRNHVR